MDAIKFGVHRLIDSEDEEHGNAVLRAIRISSSNEAAAAARADLRHLNGHSVVSGAGAGSYLCAAGSPVLNGRVSRSKSRSPHEEVRSRSRSSSSELEVDSPPHSPRSHSLMIPPVVASPAPPPVHHPHHNGNHTTSLELGQMGKRSELFSVTNLLRDDLPKVHKSPFGVNIFRPHLDVLR